MRTLQKNKQKLYYALYSDSVPVYERDSEGNIVYIEIDGAQVPAETGETNAGYGSAVPFFGNIAFQGGDAEAQEFGLNLSDYSAVLVVQKGSLPIDETSIIWHTTEPVEERDGTADEKSADYTVVKLAPSLNYDRYALKRMVK